MYWRPSQSVLSGYAALDEELVGPKWDSSWRYLLRQALLQQFPRAIEVHHGRWDSAEVWLEVPFAYITVFEDQGLVAVSVVPKSGSTCETVDWAYDEDERVAERIDEALKEVGCPLALMKHEGAYQALFEPKVEALAHGRAYSSDEGWIL